MCFPSLSHVYDIVRVLEKVHDTSFLANNYLHPKRYATIILKILFILKHFFSFYVGEVFALTLSRFVVIES